jgi:general secretion pathway protein B
MSYILDALKRADSDRERERGLVPGLHAQPVPPGKPAKTINKVNLSLVAMLGLTLVLAAVLLWRWLSPEPPVAQAVASTAPQQTAPAPAPAAGLAVPPPVAANNVTPSKPEQPLPDKAPSAPARSERPEKPRMAMAPAQMTSQPQAEDKPGTKPGASDAAPAPARPKPVVKPAPASPRLPPLSELPQEIRAALPKLAVSGATYSDNPAWRMLIINGQVFREGEKITTDLYLAQIRPKAAVLDYKGQRYLMAY